MSHTVRQRWSCRDGRGHDSPARHVRFCMATKLKTYQPAAIMQSVTGDCWHHPALASSMVAMRHARCDDGWDATPACIGLACREAAAAPCWHPCSPCRRAARRGSSTNGAFVRSDDTVFELSERDCFRPPPSPLFPLIRSGRMVKIFPILIVLLCSFAPSLQDSSGDRKTNAGKKNNVVSVAPASDLINGIDDIDVKGDIGLPPGPCACGSSTPVACMLRQLLPRDHKTLPRDRGWRRKDIRLPQRAHHRV